MDQQKYKTENKILRLSLGGTITFTVLEIIASFVLGSKTVMTDGIFDLFDLLLLLPMFILVPFLYKPVSEKKPYGFSQIESLLVLVKYIVLLIVVINMITNNITVLLHGCQNKAITIPAMIAITALPIIGKILPSIQAGIAIARQTNKPLHFCSRFSLHTAQLILLSLT